MYQQRVLLQWIGLFIVTSLGMSAAAAYSLPQELTQSPIFLFHNDNGKDIICHGTGFLIRFDNPSNKQQDICYLVTAKHVLYKNGKLIPNLLMRMDKIGSGSEMRKIDLILNGPNQTVWFHPDGVTDAAAVQIESPDPKIYDITLLSDEMILTKQAVMDNEISEGSEIFYSGMLIHHAGVEKNAPHVRCGRLSMLPEEKVNWQGNQCDLYLADVPIFGGSSGSPAFFACTPKNKKNAAAGTQYKLGGIMIGNILITENGNTFNAGISAITPGYKLHEILFSEPIRSKRGF